jgi:hypothetical protein
VLQDAMKYPAGNGSISSGISLEPFASMINHSCDPNSWWTFNGRELQMRAVRDISAGEEMTISYITISGSYNIRQESLLTGWGFKCVCTLCEMGQLGPKEGHLRTKLLAMHYQEQDTNNGMSLSNTPLRPQGSDLIQVLLLLKYIKTALTTSLKLATALVLGQFLTFIDSFSESSSNLEEKSKPQRLG